MNNEPSETQAKPDERREVRKKTDAQKQQEKDAMINLWMGDMQTPANDPATKPE